MKYGYKKAIAAAAAIACTASLCGCADTGYLMKVDGMDIRNGMYLSYEVSSYGNAYSEISSAREEQGDTSEVEDVFAETIDGKSASEWIKEDTLKQVRRYVAINRLSEENGISLTAEEQNDVNSDINSVWDDENYYAQYFYGTDTMGEYYESIGVGKDSMKEVYRANALLEKLFLHYYDAEGTTPVSDADFDAYLKENYASAFVLEVEKTDYQGLSVEDEEGLAQIKERAQSYADMINNGEGFAAAKYEYDLLNAQNEARVDAEDEYAELAESGEAPEDLDAFVAERVNAATVDKAEDDMSVVTTFSKTGSAFDADVTDYIWAAADDGKASVFESDYSFYVVARLDVTANADWKADNRVSVLKAMKNDEFEDILAAEGETYTVEINDYLVNKKYAPEKIKGIE